MLDKDDAKKSGFTMKDSQILLPDERAERLEQVKSLLPPLVNGDGRLDDKALREFLGIEGYGLAGQGYGLNFAGKGLAKIKADEPTGKELKQEKEQSKDWDTTENVIIRGDNLDALKILRRNYTGKVKMIYIDPPYNTDSDAFIYSDSFKETEAELIEKYQLDEDSINFFENLFGTKTHSGWLYFLYPRLKLARDLMTDDGVMFISIDDNEHVNLNLICNELFGEENVESMVWHKVADDSGKMKVTHRFRKEHESIIVCYKNRELVFFGKYLSDRNYKNEYTNPDDDCRGAYKQGIISHTEEKSNKNSEKYFSVTTPSGKVVTRQWRVTEEEFQKLDQDNRIYYGKSGDAIPSLKVFVGEPKVTTPMSILYDLGTSKMAGTELENLLGDRKVFNNPKPTKLIKHLVDISESSSVILDFFAGSGTTAEAVIRQNKEDGGKRKFILVQWDEKIDKNKNPNAHDFCTENGLDPVISSICIQRVNRAGEKIKEEAGLEGGAMDIGYKVFSLTPRPKLETDESGQISLGNLRSSPHDTLYNMMSASGQCLLSDPIEEKEKGLLYKVGDAYFLLGECATDLKPLSGHRIYVDGYANISLEKWLNTIGLDKETVTILY